MNDVDARARYLDQLEHVPIREVSVGFMDIELLAGDELDQVQIGFAVAPDGTVLTGTDPRDWKEHWLVIAMETSMDDPIFIDTRDPALPVYTVGHDMDWSAPTRIADSFEGFGEGLRLVHETAGGNTTPIQLEENPLSDEALGQLIKRVLDRNPESDTLFWRSFFRFGEA